jgi:hypothetical protein
VNADVARWLQTAVETPGGVAPEMVVLRLGLAFLLGWLIAIVYRWTHHGEPYTQTFPATLTLLAILIAAITQVIGDNVARAFSLVGALSVVRFRTVVRDTRDTAFVIFAVIAGMAVGSAHLWIAMVSLVVVGAAAALTSPRGSKGAAAVVARGTAEFRLVLRFAPGVRPIALLEGPVAAHLVSCETLAVATTRGGATLEATYDIVLRDESAATDLVEALNGIEGVQGVDLRRAAE